MVPTTRYGSSIYEEGKREYVGFIIIVVIIILTPSARRSKYATFLAGRARMISEHTKDTRVSLMLGIKLGEI